MERFARSAAGRGHLVGIDYSDGGPWRSFVHTYGWSFPVFSDPNGRTLDAYGVSIGLPATVVLDSRGQIVKTSHADPDRRAPAQRAHPGCSQAAPSLRARLTRAVCDR